MTPLDFKIRDVYSGTLVRARTSNDLKDWLRERYRTLMPEQERCIDGLCAALDNDEDPTWWGAACGLNIELIKKARRKK